MTNTWIRMLEPFRTIGINEIVEIAILIAGFYYLLLLLRGTRGAQVMTGLIVLIVILIATTRLLNLYTLNWILKQFSPYLAISFVILFHPEIRRALAELGRQHVFTPNTNRKDLAEHLVKAALLLSERKIGALIAVEREIGTRAFIETGSPVDALISPELIASIFYPRSPLHDGGIIIRDNRLVAASCLFPLSANQELSKSLGTRHRAAVGLTEETDAVAIIVSEETGNISIAVNGKLYRGLNETRLQRYLDLLLVRDSSEKNNASDPNFRLFEEVQGGEK